MARSLPQPRPGTEAQSKLTAFLWVPESGASAHIGNGADALEDAGDAGGGETATPPWFAWTGLERVETVPAMAPGKSAFLVTGDPSRNKELCLPGGGFATVRIRLPKAWDALMAERGYAPLETFFVR